MGLFSISCKKATYLTSKKEEGKLKWVEKIQLSSHLAICSICRLFEQQTQQITHEVKHIHSNDTLSDESKKKMEKAMAQL